MANWLERAQTVFQKGPSPITAKTTETRISTVTAVPNGAGSGVPQRHDACRGSALPKQRTLGGDATPTDPDVDRRRTKAFALLAANPSWRVGVVVEAGDLVTVGIAIRNGAYGELEIAAADWDPKVFFRLLDQHAAADPVRLH